jgi:hypothetical protein
MNDVDGWIYFDGPEPELLRPEPPDFRKCET